MTDKELDKNAARRLAIIRHAEAVTGNVALTCRYYEISRQVFCRWLCRSQAEGLAGLRDRSRRPLHRPHEPPAEVVSKIIYLRQNHHFGQRLNPAKATSRMPWHCCVHRRPKDNSWGSRRLSIMRGHDPRESALENRAERRVRVRRLQRTVVQSATEDDHCLHVYALAVAPRTRAAA